MNKGNFLHANQLLFGNKSLSQINRIVQLTIQRCQKCLIRKKNHYCMQSKCKKKQLICWNCDTNDIQSEHYMHQYTYVIPLFSKDVFAGFTNMISHFEHFQEQLQAQIQKIVQYTQNLQQIDRIVLSQIQTLKNQQISRNFTKYDEKLEQLLENYKNKNLSQIFDGIGFISTKQCIEKEEGLKQQILKCIDKLKWLNDPQKQLKNLLSFKVPQDYHEVVLTSSHPVQITQIDNFFKATNQYYTQNLTTHKVQLKIQNQLCNKNKFYEAFIYHFKDCTRLSICNGNINQIKTPLTFKSLKHLEFKCNIQTDALTVKLQNISSCLQSLVLKRFRQDDIKNLKHFTNNSQKLHELHLEFYNKCDLSSSKELIQYLQASMKKDLKKFVFKIRTESQIKRLYGYLSKFCKQNPEPSHQLNNCLLELLKQNKNLHTVIIEGVKPLDARQVMNLLKNIPYLISYRIYYDNIDIMQQLGNTIKQLEKTCDIRKRVLYGLAKNMKYKNLPKNIMKDVMQYLYT